MNEIVRSEDIEKKRTMELKKHVSTIHCSNSLSLLQRKISNVLLYHAFPYLKDHKQHSISVKQLCDHLHYQGHNYDVIKNALRALVSTVLEWNLTSDSNEEDWTASSIIASVNISGAICTYAYSPHMIELLHSPAMYGKVNLITQSKFTSNYGLALYENCVRYKGLPQTKEFPIDVFRKIMGVSDDKYTIFRDFKRRVLDKAVEEVNALSDLIVTPVLKRAGRKVVSITFQLKERPRKKRFNMQNTEDSLDANIKDKLEKIYGLESDRANKLISRHGAAQIQNKMQIIETSKVFLTGQIHNMSGYLIDALKNDYSSSQESTVSLNEVIKLRDSDKERAQQQEKEATQKRQQEDKRLSQKLLSIVDGLQGLEREKLLAEFETLLDSDQNTYVFVRYKKHAFMHPAVMAAFKRFIIDQYSSLWDRVIADEVVS